MVEFGSSEAGKKGAKARAQSLSSDQRSEIARQAATARWGREGKPRPVQATHEGELKIGDAAIPCAVLEGGVRVISQRGMSAALGRHVTGSGSSGKSRAEQRTDGVARLPNFLSANNLKPFIDLELAASLSEPIEYVPLHGGRTAYGFKAELFPRICDVWLKARDEGVLTDSQEKTAAQAYILIRALAHVAIIALVDEATGYQRDRARDELAKILEAFVAKEIQKYLSTFDLEFYELMCEVRGEPLERAKRRPKYFGKLTNNLVYCRLAPGVFEELKRLSPADERGYRKTKLFQGLTPDYGHPKLKEHLAGVTTALKLAKIQRIGWVDFLALLDKTHPKFQPMPPMPLFDNIDDREGQ
jgi:hypothetical protein